MIEDAFEKIVWALLAKQELSREEARKAAQILNETIIPRMMGVLIKIGTDKVSAEEIAKEAVDRATMAIASYDSRRARLSTWMTKIAINLLNEKHRRALLPSTGTVAFDELIPGMKESASYTDEEVFEDDSTVESGFTQKVKTVFPRLSYEDQVLINFDINGVPKESYIDLFKINDTTYRQRKSRAYRRLHDLLG